MGSLDGDAATSPSFSSTGSSGDGNGGGGGGGRVGIYACFALGGSNSLECYEPGANTWRRVGELPGVPDGHVLKGFAVVALGDFVYVIGGRLCRRKRGGGGEYRDTDVDVRGDVVGTTRAASGGGARRSSSRASTSRARRAAEDLRRRRAALAVRRPWHGGGGGVRRRQGRVVAAPRHEHAAVQVRRGDVARPLPRRGGFAESTSSSSPAAAADDEAARRRREGHRAAAAAAAVVGAGAELGGGVRLREGRVGDHPGDVAARRAAEPDRGGGRPAAQLRRLPQQLEGPRRGVRRRAQHLEHHGPLGDAGHAAARRPPAVGAAAVPHHGRRRQSALLPRRLPGGGGRRRRLQDRLPGAQLRYQCKPRADAAMEKLPAHHGSGWRGRRQQGIVQPVLLRAALVAELHYTRPKSTKYNVS